MAHPDLALVAPKAAIPDLSGRRDAFIEVSSRARVRVIPHWRPPRRGPLASVPRCDGVDGVRDQPWHPVVGVVQNRVTREAGLALLGGIMAPCRFQVWWAYGSVCWHSGAAARG